MNKREREFVNTVWNFYRKHKRANLPWRQTKDPYRILVSEIMLQQTQVERVLPKYQAFIKRWPNAATLAEASLGEVLREWQGLGYNRRAQNLHRCAQVVSKEYAGSFPKTCGELKDLPGIGPYTAGAIMAFAYNQAVPIIETNIRTVYLHHFFKNKSDVRESDIAVLVGKTLDPANPREWYWALMDYGAHLKQTVGNLNVRAQSYAKQSTFKGSDRQIRGAIIRELTKQSLYKRKLLQTLADFDADRVAGQLQKLTTEAMVVESGGRYALPA